MRLYEFTDDTLDDRIDESILIDFLAQVLPREIKMWLQRKVHRAVYPKILGMQKELMQKRGLSDNVALVKAAQTYGVDPKELYYDLSK